jgi:pimeloyl-ACP methyl ester carboxylesterase
MKTIVWLHGLNCSPTIFSHLHHQLPEHEPLFIEYDSFQSVEDSYKSVLSQIKQKKVSVIGHSLGGVIGMLLASRDNGITVEKLATISSPFGGSKAAMGARILFPRFKVFKDIDPKSEIINEVSKAKISHHLSIISTGGSLPIMFDDNDSVVSVTSQRASQTKMKIEVESNHFEAVQNVETLRNIEKFLFRSV